MERYLLSIIRRGLIGAVPLVAACSCPDQRIVRAPAALAGMTIPLELSSADCERLCGPRVTKCERIRISNEPVEAGRIPTNVEWTVLCKVPSYCPGGRRPAGLQGQQLAEAGLGEHFAELARIEAASVHAFLELAVELELHGAPRALVDAARRAALEEVEHARLTAQLARDFGVEPSPPEVAPTPPRDLAAILVENATEGLVHERYGAALAAERARHAREPAVRRAMRTIARDEWGHAVLSGEVHVWGRSRIPHAARRRVDEARARTAHELREAVDVEPTPALAVLTGMPSATRVRDLLPS